MVTWGACLDNSSNMFELEILACRVLRLASPRDGDSCLLRLVGGDTHDALSPMLVRSKLLALGLLMQMKNEK